MKNDKTDPRSRFTRSVFKESLIQIMKQKPLNKITVTELCQKAGINRGTFYNHFYDVPNVFEVIERELKEEFIDKLSGIQVHTFNKEFFREIMLIIYKNSDVVRIIFEHRNESLLIKELMMFIKDKFTKELSGKVKGELKSHNIEHIFLYAAYGSLGVVSDWVSSGMAQTPDEIAETIDLVNSLVIFPFVNES